MSRRLRFVFQESFGLKVISAFIVVIIIVLTAFTLFAVVHEGDKAKAELREEGEMLAELLAQGAFVGIFAENEQLLAASAEGIASLKDVVAVSIYNADFKLLYFKDKTASLKSYGASPLRQETRHLSTAQSVTMAETPDFFEFMRPVAIASASYSDESLYFGSGGAGAARLIGYVRIVVNKESYRKEIVAILERNAVIMLILICCSVAIVSLAVAKVTQPLEKLTESVKALEQGGPVEQAPVETKDEIGNLASAFNAMAASRLQTEESLRESERKFRMLTETAAAAIFISQDASLRYLNSTTEKMTGYTREELSRMDFSDLVHTDYRRMLHGGNGSHPSGDAAAPRREVKIITKTGEERWVDFTSGVMEFEGRPAVLGTAYDVTERKKLEAQFLQAHKMEAVGLLAGGVAHDFNNMLTVITGYSQILKKKISGQDALVPMIDQILSASERAATLTHSLLAFSRKQIIHLQPVSVNEIVIGIGKLLGRIIGEDIELILDLTGREMTILADAGQCGQVLMNLATNARDAMPEGGSLTIKTEQVDLDQRFIRTHGFGRKGAYAMLAITDTGSGMADKTRERIFEPFFTTKEVGKGSGLGLSIVYGIVKQHDGFIIVSSQPGAGTTFKIYFPLVTSPAHELARAESAAPPRGTETVLVAEDDRAVRGLAATLLAESGYTVIEAEDGEQAVEKFRKNKDRVDLLVLDVIMPRKNGNEAFEDIRGIRSGTKVLFMSGYAGDIFKKKNIPEKSLNIIPKPISPTEFLKKIRETLDIRC